MILNLILLIPCTRQNQLVLYKNTHNGDCNVSKYDELWKQLGQWVNRQRNELGPLITNENASRKEKSRIKRLEAIGFKWSLRMKTKATPSTHKSAGNGLCFRTY
jgi:hypothetical protein